MSATSPIIIIGMHRSGTSLVSRSLEQLGMFMGKRVQQDHEALFFVNLNRWLLQHNGARWANPTPFLQVLEDEQFRPIILDYLKHIMQSPHAISYLGWKRYLRYRGILSLDFAWGWKDPRNTFTLPLWMDIFPDAKIIHIYRNGVDVASSLKTRWHKIHHAAQARQLHNKRKQTFQYWLHRRKNVFLQDIRCSTLEGGFSLWETYLKEAQRHVQHYQAQAIEIKFEDFLQSPKDTLTELVDFCGVMASPNIIHTITQNIDSSRAYPYRTDPQLAAFANNMQERMARYGY